MWTITACAATSPGASTAAPWKARSTPTAAQKAAGRRRRNKRSGSRLEGLVRAVAEGLVAGVLASAQPEFFCLGHREFHRRKLRPLVRAVTERLAFRTPAAAPPVVTGGELYRVGGLLRDVGFGHDPLLLGAQTPGSRWDRRPAGEYNPAGGPRYNDAMKLLFDLFPVALFFVAFKLFDIYTATAVAIAATFLQIGWLKWRRRKVDTMMWITLAIIVVFGGATLALHDETFIKWKPTVLYWLFGAVIATAQSLFRRNLVRAMLGEQVRMPDGVWTRLNWSWVGFFTFMGAANLLVAYNFSTDTWVNFKLFGGMGLMLVFVVLQALFLARHVEEKDVSS